MGFFGKKKETEEIPPVKSEEEILKDDLRLEVETLQKEFRANQEEVRSITDKIKKVKEEYNIAVNDLMLLKKETNVKRMELDSLQREYKNIKLKINEESEKLIRNKQSAEEIDKTEMVLVKSKQELSGIIKQHEEIKKKITNEEYELQNLLKQKIQEQNELEEINARMYDAKHQSEKNTQQSSSDYTSNLAQNEREFISEEIKKESKGIIEAASVVVGSLKSKLNMAERELETVQKLLEKERDEHAKTREEFEKIKNKIQA